MKKRGKKMATNQLDTIADVSSAIHALPSGAAVRTGSGEFALKRLSWLAFEALSGELLETLGPLLTAAEPTPDTIAAQLAGAPGLVLKLVSLSSGLSEDKLSRMDCDDVLALASAAIRLNFTEGAGLRAFFTELAVLAGVVEASPGAPSAP